MQNETPLSLFEILRLVWRERRIVFILLGSFYVIAFGYVFFADKNYLTTMVISPIQDERSMQIANLAKVVTGNETPGIVRPGGIAEFMHLLTSPIVADGLIEDEKVVRTIFRSEWDEKAQTWHAPRSVFSAFKRAIYRMLGYPPYLEPSPYRLSEYLKKAILIEPLKGSQLVSVYMLGEDREFSEYLLDKIFYLSDKFLRQQRIEKTYATLDHLGKRINTVENIVHRKSLADLLLYSEQELILLETDQPFAARKLVASRSSDWPVSPRPKVAFVLATALALLLGTALILFLRLVRIQKALWFK